MHSTINNPCPTTLFPPVAGRKQQQYVWDGRRIRLARISFTHTTTLKTPTIQERVACWVRGTLDGISHAFFPNPHDVTPDYWGYAQWRAMHRVFSSMGGVFATQSMLQAVGVGAQRSLPASAAINWVLKDGLGRLGRLSVATQWGRSFDADLKVGWLMLY